MFDVLIALSNFESPFRHVIPPLDLSPRHPSFETLPNAAGYTQ
jgi:hypothetical protein